MTASIWKFSSKCASPNALGGAFAHLSKLSVSINCNFLLERMISMKKSTRRNASMSLECQQSSGSIELLTQLKIKANTLLNLGHFEIIYSDRI